VIQLRSPRDNSAPPSNVGIDDIVNGIFLDKVLHSMLGTGEVAFIKVWNFGSSYLGTVLTNLRHQTMGCVPRT
jgi:hypothetical protein